MNVTMDLRQLHQVPLEEVYSYLLDQLKNASRILYEGLLEGFHHDTGFIARHLEELRRYTGSEVALPPLNNRYPSGAYKKFNGLPRTAEHAYTYGHVAIQRALPELSMTFTSDLIYYPIQDIFGFRSNPPWQATEKAIKVAIDHFESLGITDFEGIISASIARYP